MASLGTGGQMAGELGVSRSRQWSLGGAEKDLGTRVGVEIAGARVP